MTLSAEVGSAPGAPPSDLARFDVAERTLHWVNATLFAVVMATAAALYVGPISGLIGRRELVRTIHVYTGLALPIPFLIALAPRVSRQLREDVRRLNRWMADDRRWLRSFGRDPFLRLGKFHPGQKLNGAVTVGAIPVMVLTGSIMRWFSPFPLSWRTGATFVHDWVAFTLFVFITGHVVKAVSDGEAMRGMFRGRVGARWAARHHPRWYEEQTGLEAPPRPGRR